MLPHLFGAAAFLYGRESSSDVMSFTKSIEKKEKIWYNHGVEIYFERQ